MVFKTVLEAWFNSFNSRVIVDANGTRYTGVLGKVSQSTYMVVTEDNSVYALQANRIVSIEVKRGSSNRIADGIMIITCDESRRLSAMPNDLQYDF